MNPSQRAPLSRFSSADSSPINGFSTVVIIAFCLLMLAVPWEDLWGGRFLDRGVYLSKFALNARAGRIIPGGYLSYVTNEVLWDSIIKWCTAGLHVPIEVLFGVISFLCLFVYSKYLVSKHGLLSLILLVNPLVVDFAFSQLRMALAVSLLMLALFRRNQRSFVLVFVALACCIHTATFLFLLIYFCVKILTARLTSGAFSRSYYWLGLVAIGVAVVVLIGPLREGLLNAIGDRRAVQDTAAQSIRYASFWILLILVAATQKKKYFETEGNALAVAFVAVYVCASFLDVYNVRFLSASYPLIISSLLALSMRKKVLILPVYFVYVGIQWYYWLDAGLQ